MHYILLLLISLLNVTPASAQTTCPASDLASLSSCVSQSNVRVELQNSITLVGGAVCGTPMSIQSRSNVTLDGNGYTIKREGTGVYSCSMIEVIGSSNVTFEDVTFDDGDAASCAINTCARMIHIHSGSNNVTFDNAHVKNGKDYALYFRQSTNLNFVNSSMHNAGIVGLYFGDGSTGAVITNSIFTETETNGLAILGGNDVTIRDNYFEGNHRFGKFAVAPQFGFPPDSRTGGGQAYISSGTNIEMCNNTVVNGGQNCPANKCAGGVSGIELGLPGQQSLTNVIVRNNVVENHTSGFPILLNAGSSAAGNSDITNNGGYNCAAVTRGSNEYKIDGNQTIDLND